MWNNAYKWRMVQAIFDQWVLHNYFVLSLNTGYSAGLVSESFETTPPGFPGSPSHLSVTNHSVDSVVLCWRESAIGRPFTTYNVEITESLNTLRSKVLKFNISSVRHVEGCEAGAKVHII